jgi:hypothetical protein
VLCTCALIFGRTREPTFEGRPLSAWRKDYLTRKSFRWGEAVERIGTNAIPFEIRNLALNDSWWHTNYAARYPKLPPLLKRIFPEPQLVIKEAEGANLFHYTGSNSVPLALALLKHPSPTVRRAALWGLGSLRKQTAIVTNTIPQLIDALDDPDRLVRYYACLAIAEMGPDAASAVPTLTRVLSDTGDGAQTNDFFYLRAEAAVALGRIGPAASKSLPALETAVHESNSYLRGQSAAATWRVSSNADLALPVLLREMATNYEDMKWDWIVAVGEMGPRATSAIPQLKIELRTDQMPWVLKHVTNALKSIDSANQP